MSLPHLIQDENLRFYLIPVIIFLLRITDVSIGTIRIIYVSRGNKVIAPILGFFEVFIWALAISNIIQHLDNWWNYIAYAAGFACGNFIGMTIEERLAVGVSLLKVITRKELTGLAEALNDKGIATTVIEAKGKESEVNIIYSVVKRKFLPLAVGLVREFNPSAFFTIEDIKYISHDNSGMIPSTREHRRFYLFRGWRKGK